MQGFYRDRVTGRDAADHGWRKNRIVATAGNVIAGLLKGDLSGHRLYLAIGAGRQAPSDQITRLAMEVTRVAIDPAALRYLDPNDRPIAAVTARLGLEARVSPAHFAPVIRLLDDRGLDRQITEFGLFLTDSGRRDQGTLINYVAHDPIPLDERTELRRTIVLSLIPEAHVPPPPPPAAPAGPQFDPRTTPEISVGDRPMSQLASITASFQDSVGRVRREIQSLGDLAAAPDRPPAGMTAYHTQMWPIYQGQARAFLQLAVQLDDIPALHAHTLTSILGLATADLLVEARRGGADVTAEDIQRLQAQAGVLVALMRGAGRLTMPAFQTR